MEIDFNDIEDVLKKLKKLTKGHNHQDMIVTKSFPCKKEWTERFNGLMASGKDISTMFKKAQVERNNLWSEIQKVLDSYDGHLSYNEKTGEIDLYDEIDKEKSVKSPYA